MADILSPHTQLPIAQGEQPPERIRTATTYDQANGRGLVKLGIPGTDKAFILLPAEARELGLRLIVESERALSDAVFLRCATEVFDVHINDAMQVMLAVGAGTRADHAKVYEEILKAREQTKKLEEMPDGTPQ